MLNSVVFPSLSLPSIQPSSIHPSIHSSIHLSSIHPPSVHPSNHHPSIYPSITHLYTHPPKQKHTHPSSTHPSIHPSFIHPFTMVNPSTIQSSFLPSLPPSLPFCLLPSSNSLLILHPSTHYKWLWGGSATHFEPCALFSHWL